MSRAQLLCLGVLLCVLSVLGLSRGLWTPDEPREAGISREMAGRPAVIPTLNGEPFVEKPPLYYWTAALALRVAGGPSVRALRAVSTLAALGTLAVTFLWVRRAVSAYVAAIAAVLLSTFAAFVISTHWVRIDILLTLFCTIAIASAWERIAGRGGALPLVGFYGGLILALWTKGLIGPVLVGAGLATYAAFSRSVRVLAPLRPVPGVAVLGAAVATLALAIAAGGGVEALRTWLFVNHVQRFVHPVVTGHEAPIAYYAWRLPLAIMPWLVPGIALLNPRGSVWRKERPEATLARFAGAMTIGALAVLTASSSKREVYLLPVLAPIALLMAIAVRDRIEAASTASAPGFWARTGIWLQALFLAAVGMAPAIALGLKERALTVPVALAALAGLLTGSTLLVAVARGQVERAFWTGVASFAVALAATFLLIVPRVDAVKDFGPFIREVDRLLPAGRPVAVIGADETMLGIIPFFTGRHLVRIDASDAVSSEFVLVQSSGVDPGLGAVQDLFERIAARDFGARRRMALWRRR